MSVRPTSPHDTVADYDSNDYDYQTFWTGRDYEHWAETVVLTRLMQEAGPQREWFADFGVDSVATPCTTGIGSRTRCSLTIR